MPKRGTTACIHFLKNNWLSQGRFCKSLLNRRSGALWQSPRRGEPAKPWRPWRRTPVGDAGLADTEATRATEVWRRKLGTVAADAAERSKQHAFPAAAWLFARRSRCGIQRRKYSRRLVFCNSLFLFSSDWLSAFGQDTTSPNQFVHWRDGNHVQATQPVVIEHQRRHRDLHVFHRATVDHITTSKERCSASNTTSLSHTETHPCRSTRPPLLSG